MKPLHQLILSFVLLVELSGSSMAFTQVNPITTSFQQASIRAITSSEASREPLHLSHNNNDRGLHEDWSALTKAFGNFVQHVGTKVVDAVKQGGNKLKEFVTTSFLPSHEKDPSDIRSSTNIKAASTSRSIFIDTEDEDMFRNIIGKDLFDPPTSESIDSIVDQAALLLQQDELATSLLGTSLQYGRPFSQSTRTTSINGKTSTSAEAKFAVFGTMAQGVATVTSNDGRLVYMDLEVNDRLYRLKVVPPANNAATAPNRGRNYYQDPHPWAGDYYGYEEDFNQDDTIVAEVLEGVRGRTPYRGVLDAEILGKRFI